MLVREFVANSYKRASIVIVRRKLVDFQNEIINSNYQLLAIENNDFARLLQTKIDYDIVLRELNDEKLPEDENVTTEDEKAENEEKDKDDG
ncbi:hypothetical protein ACH5RR_006886 [Cinchona calisaya]|uniref:Uncharacterized protein n=1 Tax=Cinchona calisaya TaxID=153742 RepID=A0ABD3AQB8_9GENT